MPKREDFEILADVLDKVHDRVIKYQFDKSILEDMRYILVTKGEDYSGTNHTWWNFEEAAFTTGTDVDDTFLVMLGVKYARIKSLLEQKRLRAKVDKGLKVNYESLEDTFVDLANYCILYVGYLRWMQLKEKVLGEFNDVAEP